jgi:hypothetical protein
MPLLPQFGDSKNNLIAKIAINTGPNPPLRGDGMWNLEKRNNDKKDK